ncbi:MAG: hypothetical protein ACM3JD_09645 [Rudaea sp.]
MTQYEIRVKGYLDACWSEWFDGLSIAHDPDRCETRISGPVADQTALYTLLIKARDLSLMLVSVRLLDQNDPEPFS